MSCNMAQEMTLATRSDPYPESNDCIPTFLRFLFLSVAVSYMVMCWKYGSDFLRLRLGLPM